MAASASITNNFFPLSIYSSFFSSADICIASGSHRYDSSVSARARIILPSATSGRILCFCSSDAVSSIIEAPNIPDEKYGPGRGPVPSASNKTPALVRLLPTPPYSSGIIIPIHPISTTFFHSSSVMPVPVSCKTWTTSFGASRFRKSRADFLSICSLSLYLRSKPMIVLRDLYSYLRIINVRWQEPLKSRFSVPRECRVVQDKGHPVERLRTWYLLCLVLHRSSDRKVRVLSLFRWSAG